MARASHLVLAALAAGTVLAYALHRCDLHRFAENLRRYSAPDASIYDALTARPLDGFFGRVAGEVAGSAPGAGVLEVGSRPGRTERAEGADRSGRFGEGVVREQSIAARLGPVPLVYRPTLERNRPHAGNESKRRLPRQVPAAHETMAKNS